MPDAPSRLDALDAFRGLTIAAMILVSTPGTWNAVYTPLDHAAWHGWTPTDLVFPFLLFAMGAAVPFALARRRGIPRGVRRHVIRRAAILFLLGLMLNAIEALAPLHLSTFRIPGVLQRIAIVYLAVAWLTERASLRAQIAVAALWVKPQEYPSTRPDWETALRRGPFHFNPNVRRRPEDYPVVSTGGHPPTVLMFNAVGGSTIHYTAHFPRFHPSDFRVKSLDGVADDWPIRYEDLEPYYDMNDREMGVAGLAGDPANPPRSPRPTPPLPLGVLGETIGRGFDKLGWYWWVSDNAIISREYQGRPAGAKPR